jgi:hypothetical protein
MLVYEVVAGGSPFAHLQTRKQILAAVTQRKGGPEYRPRGWQSTPSSSSDGATARRSTT